MSTIDADIAAAAKRMRACDRLLDGTTDLVQMHLLLEARSRAADQMRAAIRRMGDDELFERLGVDLLAAEIAIKALANGGVASSETGDQT